MARARYEKKKLDEHRSRAGHIVQSRIVLSNEQDEDEDDTGRLSELITLAEVGLQVEEAEDDTGRLSELIALAEGACRRRRMTTRSSLKPQRPQMKRRSLTICERQIRVMQVSLATATGLLLRISARTMSCLLSMFLS